MSTQLRQSTLFSAEDWTVVYQAFSKIDLTSYDFDTIRTSIIGYLQITYPDNFNDWIGNQEFIFILDTLCYLGQNLSFRMDLNSRDNFIDTAQRRASILRLAQMLSYSPKRNYPGRGLVKITQISTTQDVKDSNGTSLVSTAIKWNDPLNVDWYEQFVTVLNANLTTSNPFGQPVKKVYIDSIMRQLYKINSAANSSVAIPFSASVNGNNMTFEIVNPDIDTTGVVFERHPDPAENKYIIYMNDGNGFDSPNTGFFMFFKQGTLKYEDYPFYESIENRTQTVSASSINEIDLWFQKILADSTVTEKWTKVPTTQSVMYNSINQQVKTIYSSSTGDNDTVTLSFPSSDTGTVPKGIYRSWFRVSSGTEYAIKTVDMQDKTISYSTNSKSLSATETYSLDIRFSLQYQVQNAQAQETNEQIKTRAPQMYYTNNRLITGEDYNIGTLSEGSLIKKAKAVNRTFSGHSRFIDINDPTGKYQNTNLFADDGSIYRDTTNAIVKSSESLPTNNPNSVIVTQKIQPLLTYTGTMQLYEESTFNVYNCTGILPLWAPTTTSSTYSSTGTFTTSFAGSLVGSVIKFVNPIDSSDYKWSSIISYNSDTTVYTISKSIPSGWQIQQYYMPFRSSFNTAEITAISTQMTKMSNFGLYFNSSNQTWNISTDSSTFNFSSAYSVTNKCFVKVEYNGISWNFYIRGTDYIFVGGDYVKFFFSNTSAVSDVQTGTSNIDTINVLKCNYDPVSKTAYTSNIELVIDDIVKYDNGNTDFNKVKVKSKDHDIFSISNSPYFYNSIVPSTYPEEIELFWYTDTNNEDQLITLPNNAFFVYDPTYVSSAAANKYRLNSTYRTTLDNTLVAGTVFWYKPLDIFVKYLYDRSSNDVSTLNASSMSTGLSSYLLALGLEEVTNYYWTKGRNNLYYQWKHYAPDGTIIDPAITNIHDVYVLTTNYYNTILDWSTNSTDTMPSVPTTSELTAEFSDIEKIKAISDSIIWNSGEFVPLFGTTASEEFQCRFKVIKSPGSNYSDDEIKQKVISCINTYFTIDYWDFGESFYFTEMSAYIHQQLSTDISSIVIVPQSTNSKFGSLFEIPCNQNQLFISTAKVSDIDVVSVLSSSTLKIGQ